MVRLTASFVLGTENNPGESTPYFMHKAHFFGGIGLSVLTGAVEVGRGGFAWMLGIPCAFAELHRREPPAVA